MKFWKLLCLIILIVSFKNGTAQVKVDHRQMNYIFNPKPNSILYNDTLYKGSREFSSLFYRTHDPLLIHFYEKHQSNKIWGNIASIIGSLATAGGIIIISSANSSQAHTNGWILLGAGVSSSITGTFLILQGQRNLAMAVEIFNQKYGRTTAGIGISGNRAGFVINF